MNVLRTDDYMNVKNLKLKSMKTKISVPMVNEKKMYDYNI